MKTLQIIWMSWLLLWGMSACDTKQEVIYSGISSPYHDGTIMDYLRGDDYNWKLTVELIERARLTDLFEGRVDTCKEITFWGFPSYSVKRHLLDNGLKSVEEISVEESRRLVLAHVVKGKFLKADFDFRDKDYYIYDPLQTGGTDLVSLGGNRLRAYRETSTYGGVAGAGPITLYLYSFTKEEQVPIASPDIQPTNGVVHALNYNYILGRI